MAILRRFVVGFAAMIAHRLPIRRWLTTFAAYFAVGIVGLMLPKLGAHASLPLLPSGVATAANIRWGRKMWPAVLAARLSIELGMRQAPAEAIGAAIGAAASAALTAWILQKRGFDASFSRARDVTLFIAAAALGMAVTPTFGLIGLGLSDHWATALDSLHWIRWWSNSTAGVLLIGPLLVALSWRSLAHIREHWAAGCLWLGGVAVCCAGTLSFAASGPGRPLSTAFALLLVIIGAIRFGVVVVSFAALMISVAAGLSFAFGIGIFGRLDELAGFTTLWTFSAALTGLSLLITALLAERDSAGLSRQRAERRYAQIFDASPQPLWVHDPATLEFLLVNEAAVRQYGWSREELLVRQVSVLRPPGGAPVLPDASRDTIDPASEPLETRHQTRDGRLLAVEVWTRAIDLGGRPAELVFASDVTERRALGAALIDAIANEQYRIGRELHDGLGQELTGLALSARALATRAEREHLPVATGLEQLAALANSCIHAARRIAQGVSPLTDADGSLQAALEALAARSSVGNTSVQFHARLEAPVSIDLESRNHLYRIAQEAVQNALKHARAHRVSIELRVNPARISLIVNDDGIGLPDAAHRFGGHRGAGHGMRTMHFRSSSIGGRLAIATRQEGGVSVACEVAQARSAASA